MQLAVANYYDNEIELKKFDAVDMAAVVVSKNTGLMDSHGEAVF